MRYRTDDVQVSKGHKRPRRIASVWVAALMCEGGFNLGKMILQLVIFITFGASAFAQVGAKQDDPSPDDFLMMDKEAVLDRASLAKFFNYPDSARKAGLQGTVVVKVLISKSGKAERCFVLSAVHPLLDSAATRTVMNASFSPASYAGDNIKSWMEVPVIFKTSSGRGLPIKIQGEVEGDGYTRARFDIRAAYDSLDKKLLQTLKQPSMNVQITVDDSGRCTKVQSPGVLPADVLANLQSVFQRVVFVPAVRNGQKAEDHLTLIIETQPR